MADTRQDEALTQYLEATDRVIATIQQEQQRAKSGQSMADMDAWDRGWFDVQNAVEEAKKARDAYQGELREKNYNF